MLCSITKHTCFLVFGFADYYWVVPAPASNAIDLLLGMHLLQHKVCTMTKVCCQCKLLRRMPKRLPQAKITLPKEPGEDGRMMLKGVRCARRNQWTVKSRMRRISLAAVPRLAISFVGFLIQSFPCSPFYTGISFFPISL